MEAWRERMRTPHHPLVSSHYCCDRWFFYIDLMHLADCKGASAIAFGSVLELLLKRCDLGRNRAERMAVVNRWMTNWYDQNPGQHRLPELRQPSNVRQADGWADLHGPTVKAANTRAAAPLIRDLAAEFFGRDLEFDRRIVAVSAKLAEFYELLYGCHMFMSTTAVQRLRAIVLDIGEHWLFLRDHAKTRKQLLWKVTPKVHKIQHIPLYAEVLNPRYIQVYGEESLIGTTCLVWKKSMAGRYKKVAQRQVLLKRLLGLLLRFEA